MNLIVNPRTLSGTIAVPGSKSHTIRAVALAMMADGVSRIHALAAVRAAKALGATVDRGTDAVWTVAGTGGDLHQPADVIDMANSGTSIKIFAGLAALRPFPVSFDGDESLRSRPMAHLLSALEKLGVKTEASFGRCPFTVRRRQGGAGRGGE